MNPSSDRTPPVSRIASSLASALVALTLLIAAGPLAAQSTSWPDAFQSRLEVLAIMQTLNAEVLASRSATETLERWCRDHEMAEEPRVVACLIPGAEKAPDAELLQRLEVSDASELRYRRVELRCGTHILSKADNWYVPSRLTDAMNDVLETTDTPFGKAVSALQPYRRTFAMRILWSPLPPGWERASSLSPAGGRLAIPADLFEHRAVMLTGDHKPFAEVVETYQSEILAFRRK